MEEEQLEEGRNKWKKKSCCSFCYSCRFNNTSVSVTPSSAAAPVIFAPAAVAVLAATESNSLGPT